MTQYKYANWVKGEYLQWAREQQDGDENFKKRRIYQFLRNGYSEPTLKTLRAIAEVGPTSKIIDIKQFPAIIGTDALEIADTLLDQLDSYYLDFDINTKKVPKKQLTPVLDQFRKATNKLFDTIDYTHIYKASDLISGAPDMLVSGTNIENMCRDKKALTIALKSFWEKTAHQALLDFADEIESLGDGNPYYVMNNRAPSPNQAKIQLAVYLILDMIGVDATKTLSGLADLIVYLMDLNNENNKAEDDVQLCPRDVAPQIKAIIENYDSLQEK